MSWRTISLCVLIYLMEFSQADPATINLTLKIDDKTKTVSCEQTKENLDKFMIIVTEDSPLQLRVHGKSLNGVQCTGIDGIQNKNIELKQTSDIYNYTVDSVTLDMDGVWCCKILSFKNVKGCQPTYNKGSDTYARVECYVKIQVKSRGYRQKQYTSTVIARSAMLLVNKVVPPTMPSEDKDGGSTLSGEYQYVDGEQVDVLCVNWSGFCADVELRYDYVQGLAAMYESVSKPRLGARLRTILRTQHNGLRLTCKCVTSGGNDIDTIVTFVKKTEFHEITNCTVNGRAASAVYNGANIWNVSNFDFKCAIYDDEQLNITCSTGNAHTLGADREHCKELQVSDNNGPSLEFTMKQISNCTFKIDTYHGVHLTQRYTVNTLRLPGSGSDKLAMSLSGHTSLMEVYNKQNRLIYYEYKDGNNVSLTCSNHDQSAGELSTSMSFNGTLSTDTIINTTIPLSASDENSSFECKIGYPSRGKIEEDDSIYRSVKVVFRAHMMVDPTTSSSSTSTTTERTSGKQEHTATQPTPVTTTNKGWNETYIIAGGAAFTVIVVAALVFLTCRRRKHHQPKTTVDINYENLQCHSETSIPAHPPQWSHRHEEVTYQVPVDTRRNDDTIYAQPVTEDTYSTPVPKNLRKGKYIPTEPTYAELDLGRGRDTGRTSQYANSERSDYATVGDIYSQVVPKDKRTGEENYYNVYPNSPYVNSGATEYIEPTYCQPHTLK